MSTAPTMPAVETASMAAPKVPAMTPPTVLDDMLYEVVDGQVAEKKMSARETEIASLLVGMLTPFLRANRLGRVVGEMLFRIDLEKDLRRRPDVAFVSHTRWSFNRRVPKVTPWDMVPDLAIEVISESNTAYEVQKKIHEYFNAGVSRVWVVYPDEAEVYLYASPTEIQVLKVGQELDGGDLLPGFRLPLTALFEDDPE
jgi:Uma2 family endonuclease